MWTKKTPRSSTNDHASQLVTSSKTVENCQTASTTKEYRLSKRRLGRKEKRLRYELHLTVWLLNHSSLGKSLINWASKLATQEALEIHGYAGRKTLEQANTVLFDLEAMDGKCSVHLKDMYIREGEICSPFEPVELDINEFTNLKGLELAHDFPRQEVKIDVLLGVRHYWMVVEDDVRKLLDLTSSPTATKTVFGYVVSGPYKTNKKLKKSKCSELHVGVKIKDIEDLDVKLEKFWKSEAIGIVDDEGRPMTEDERKAKKIFDDREAERILEATERRLLSDPE